MIKHILILFSLLMLLSAPLAFSSSHAPAIFLDPASFGTGILSMLWNQIDLFWHQGEHQKIFPLFYLLTRLDPSDEEAWATGGWFLINVITPQEKDQKEKTDLIEKGVLFLQEGAGLLPYCYRLHWELGWTLYKLERLSEAIRSLTLACQFPHPWYVRSTLAHAFEKNKKIKEAIETWKKVEEIEPAQAELAQRHIQRLTIGNNQPNH
ncbi:MAG: hypothetical protein WDA18_06285 [Candidatus Ratteibacteria bacterium]